jgi:NAD(P)-dependent dehydrogenase (short-subunit alcohol dehydrogenase family)
VLAVYPGWMRTNMVGQEASISPDESADGIFQLADRESQTDEPIYMDYLGNPLPR